MKTPPKLGGVFASLQLLEERVDCGGEGRDRVRAGNELVLAGFGIDDEGSRGSGNAVFLTFGSIRVVFGYGFLGIVASRERFDVELLFLSERKEFVDRHYGALGGAVHDGVEVGVIRGCSALACGTDERDSLRFGSFVRNGTESLMGSLDLSVILFTKLGKNLVLALTDAEWALRIGVFDGDDTGPFLALEIRSLLDGFDFLLRHGLGFVRRIRRSVRSSSTAVLFSVFDVRFDLVDLPLELENLGLIEKLEGFFASALSVFEFLHLINGVLGGQVGEECSGNDLCEDDYEHCGPNAKSGAASAFSFGTGGSFVRGRNGNGFFGSEGGVLFRHVFEYEKIKPAQDIRFPFESKTSDGLSKSNATLCFEPIAQSVIRQNPYHGGIVLGIRLGCRSKETVPFPPCAFGNGFLQIVVRAHASSEHEIADSGGFGGKEEFFRKDFRDGAFELERDFAHVRFGKPGILPDLAPNRS